MTRMPALPRRLVTALPVLALVASCAPGSSLPPLPDARDEPYRLDTGDQVRILTFGEEHLTGQFRVEDSGNIAVPLLDEVPARGLTTAQLATAIADRLKSRNLIKSPSVSVEIVAYRSIFVLGEVSRPGEYSYRPGMTVLTAVALAGGFTYRAVEDRAKIQRTARGHVTEGRAGPDSAVQPGDIITIFERWI